MEGIKERIKNTIKYTIAQCGLDDSNGISNRNKYGIKIMSSHIPKKRDGIDAWFKTFTIWNNIQSQ